MLSTHSVHLLPHERGWVVARAESHAVVYLTMTGDWSDSMAEAKVLPSPLVATQHARRYRDAAVMPLAMLEWIKAPLLRVTVPEVARR